MIYIRIQLLKDMHTVRFLKLNKLRMVTFPNNFLDLPIETLIHIHTVVQVVFHQLRVRFSESKRKRCNLQRGLGCILLELFWLLLFDPYSGLGITEYTEFQFRNWERSYVFHWDLETESEVTWELLYLRPRSYSAIGSRMNGKAPKRTQIPSIPSIPIPE